jgi:hypothetical protein
MPISSADRDLLIRTVIGEADDQPDMGRAAVAHVILNRMGTGKWGDTPGSVVLARGQFEPWQKRSRELLSISPDSKSYQRTAGIVDDVLAGKTPDPTGGATHFLDPAIVKQRRGGALPDWARGQGVDIGTHRFFAPEGRAGDGLAAINKAIGVPTAAMASALPYTSDDVLKNYGVAVPTSQSPQSPTEGGPILDSATVLKNYGVTVPAAARAPTPADASADVSMAKPGKVPEVQEPPVVPTPREQSIAAEGGLTRQFVSGVPVAGPGIDALMALAGSRGGDPSQPWYDRFIKEWQTQQRAQKYYAQEHPISSLAAQTAGGLTGYGGLGLTAPGRTLLGIAPNLPWGARVYMGAGGGATINAADALLRGENPLPAAEIGAVGGLVGPTMTEAARAGTSFAASNLWPRPGALANVPRPGVNLLTRIFEGETPASMAGNRARMGPAGFFGDINPMAGDIIGGIADLPIPAKATVQEAYRLRAAGQPQRIEAAVTRATGIPSNFNVTDYEKFLTEERARVADPLYQAWRSTQVHPTKELQALIPRLEKAGAFDMAEELSGISGNPINRKFFIAGPQKDFPTTESWDYVKRGLDRRIDQAYSSGDKTLARELVKLKGDMIGEIEKTPAGQIWKQARAEFADRSALIDQLAAGRDTFLGGRAGLTPDELAEEWRHLSRPEQIARVQGMRAAVRDAMGDKTEGAGQMRSKLLAPNNQKKMRLMLGDQAAEELIGTLTQEKYLADRLPAVVPNMSTGASGQTRMERRNLFAPPQIPSVEWNLLSPSTYPGAHHLNPRNVMQSIINDRYARTAPALAKTMLTQQGPGMDDLIAALTSERARLDRVARVSRTPINALTGLVTGPGQASYNRYFQQQQPQ